MSIQPLSTRGPRRHHGEFDAQELAARANEAGVRVSVIVPARDEATTVGGIVSTIRRRLCRETSLVDEIVVVDSESSDDTASVAADAGAHVVVDQVAVLREAGPGRGKGEAIWKGLAVASGDLVVFVDADIEDFDERFVVGLVGPLLEDRSVVFTKATYERPLRVDGRLHPTGGGRVTELTAKPLLATYWPELGRFGQPLAGEYAARRAVLESLPILQGYGVDLALLVDVAAEYSTSAITEVDMDRRTHHNQPLSDLGVMATEVLQAGLDRLAAAGRPGVPALPTHVTIAKRPPLRSWKKRAAGA